MTLGRYYIQQANQQYVSPISSPRAKITRLQMGNEILDMICFLKTNLLSILALISHDATKNQESFLVSGTEFNCLKVILKSDKNELLSTLASSLYPTMSTKAKSDNLITFLNSALNAKESSIIINRRCPYNTILKQVSHYPQWSRSRRKKH